MGGFAPLVMEAVVGVEAQAKLRARFGGVAVSGAAGNTYSDGDSGSDRRMVQRVGALHHSGAALGRIIQTEC